MIGTHIRQGSPFKQALAALQPGESITMFGPVLNFRLENAPQDVVFLAQGIGITPFRSMLVHNARQVSPRRITLLHSDGFEPTFGDETAKLATSAHYPDNKDTFSAMLGRTIAANPHAWFYVSGSPEFIKDAKAFMLTNRIRKSSIKTDSFLGY